MYSDAEASAHSGRAVHAGTRTVGTHTSSTMPTNTSASRDGFWKKPGTVIRARVLTTSRRPVVVAFAAAQPRPNNQKMMGAV